MGDVNDDEIRAIVNEYQALPQGCRHPPPFRTRHAAVRFAVIRANKAGRSRYLEPFQCADCRFWHLRTPVAAGGTEARDDG